MLFNNFQILLAIINRGYYLKYKLTYWKTLFVENFTIIVQVEMFKAKPYITISLF